MTLMSLWLQKEHIYPLRIVKALMLFSFFLFFSIIFLRVDIHSCDFWWHLATGRYIIENKSLPEDDPFTYTTHEPITEREKSILRGNWLSEVIFYKIYTLWRFKGIIILRSLILMLFLIFVFMNIKKQGLSDLTALILLFGVFLITKKFTAERPQLFTFLIFSVIHYLLEDCRINASKRIYLIPLLLMLLSNMHPGYIICIVLVTVYLVGEGIQAFINKGGKSGFFTNLLIIWFLTVFLSMLNPNGATMLTRIFSIHGIHTRGIYEWLSPFSLYLMKFKQPDYPFFVFLAFSILILKYLKRIGITPLLLFIIFTIMGMVSARYLIFYMSGISPVLAKIITNLRNERFLKRLLNGLKEREGLLYLTFCITGIFLVFNILPSFAKDDYNVDTKFYAPKGAADFLTNVEIKGNMFNEYGFGGYLIWRLYPNKKVFIDGRNLEPDVFVEYKIVIDLIRNTNGKSWDDVIKKYDITYIVIPPLYLIGKIPYLIEELFIADEWILIYADYLSLIFLKNDNRNVPVIEKYAMDKSIGLNTIITQASARAMKNKANPYFLISIGKVFLIMGKLDEAEKAFKLAYKRDPNNEELKFWMERLEKKKELFDPQ
jgi:hypothetical protein